MSSAHWPPTVIESLLAARDYRSFLKLFLKPGGEVPKPLSYAALSRRAGFASRAFPREVVLGKRRLTPKSLPNFIRALGLTGDWKEYFRLLAGQEEPSLLLPSETPDHSRAKLGKVRARLLARAKASIPSPDSASELADRLLAIPEAPEIYTALGSDSSGATLEEIRARTGLPSLPLLRALDSMVDLGMARKDGTSRYFASEFHRVISQAGTSRLFQSYFNEALDRARKAAGEGFTSEEQLFMSSVARVSRADLPRLKNELRELIARFVDSAEKPDGDHVLKVVIAAHV